MSNILMLSHDQHLDRRIIAQAQSLIQIGHRVTLLALSYHANRKEEKTPEDIDLIRIGLNEIVPENSTYKTYICRQKKIEKIVQILTKNFFNLRKLWALGFNVASKLNWILYRAFLFMRYQNFLLSDPLPFCQAYIKEGAKHKADLIQVHDLPTLKAGAQLAELMKVPLIYDAHELYPEQRTFSSMQRKICNLEEKNQIQKAQLVFTVNQSIAIEMSRRYNIKQPITLLNALDPPTHFNPAQSYNLIRDTLNLPSENQILLFQGGFAPNRNLENLVQAISYVKSKNVILIMMGFGDFGNKLKKKAEKLGLLGNRIHFIPAVPQSALLQYTASATLGIIPYPHVDLNTYYCTPNKLFEYIQAGLPILANDSPELRRFIVDENFGIVHLMNSARDIAEAIDRAFDSSQMLNFKKNILEKVTKFSWQVQKKIYLEAMQPFLEKIIVSKKISHEITGEI